ncbi:MarR family transcriptional regulator [Streptomyces sp. E5N91]|uniref:MarR family winged helix-turn-helix transcriptional regulator n=1 Tax=Streptomyces sp. E5N91 TaxID=1851996 RepID=UPI000EF5900E|nr:MarR family transcriptional regulator [Streptomyces sp. E5N91]
MEPTVPEVGEATEKLTVALEHMLRHVRQSATAGGLSPASSLVLSRLTREGACRLTELARAEGVSQPNMTQLVNRMERAGLVRRVADAQDGRVVRVEVTGTGTDVFERRRRERAVALELLIQELTEEERQAVHIALPALSRTIENRQARSS